MELISLITALILGIVLKRIKNLIIVILCLMSTFIILKLFNSELILLPLKEWTLYSIFYGNNFWVYGSVIFISIWFVLYGVIPHLIKYYFLDKQFERFYNKYTQLSESATKDLESIVRRIAKFIYAIVKFLPKFKSKESEQSIQYVKDLFLNTLILLIHATLVIPYFINGTLKISIIIGLIFLYHIIVLPIMGMFYKTIEKIVDEL